ncbi:MAG: hypothetical protein AAF569_02955 [Pseudomonadota bacterium]
MSENSKVFQGLVRYDVERARRFRNGSRVTSVAILKRSDGTTKAFTAAACERALEISRRKLTTDDIRLLSEVRAGILSRNKARAAEYAARRW